MVIPYFYNCKICFKIVLPLFIYEKLKSSGSVLINDAGFIYSGFLKKTHLPIKKFMTFYYYVISVLKLVLS